VDSGLQALLHVVGGVEGATPQFLNALIQTEAKSPESTLLGCASSSSGRVCEIRILVVVGQPTLCRQPGLGCFHLFFLLLLSLSHTPLCIRSPLRFTLSCVCVSFFCFFCIFYFFCFFFCFCLFVYLLLFRLLCADAKSNSNNVFRGNSIATKALTAYAFRVGHTYLNQTLKPLILSICYTPDAWEVDPKRLDADSNLDDNVENLRAAAAMFFSKIQRSVDQVPPCLRLVCKQLQEMAEQHYPNHVQQVVGGFFFLRVICPALISPIRFGVWKGTFCVGVIWIFILLVSGCVFVWVCV
jgi:GTPase-activator protein for Ras-like GTPase